MQANLVAKIRFVSDSRFVVVVDRKLFFSSIRVFLSYANCLCTDLHFFCKRWNREMYSNTFHVTAEWFITSTNHDQNDKQQIFIFKCAGMNKKKWQRQLEEFNSDFVTSSILFVEVVVNPTDFTVAHAFFLNSLSNCSKFNRFPLDDDFCFSQCNRFISIKWWVRCRYTCHF